MIDAASALEHLTGEPVLEALASAHRYHRRVFLAPPWPEIYVADPERRHGLEAALGEYDRLSRELPRLGYEVVVLPKAEVAARVDANPGAMFAREASMAKLKATELAKRAALEGMQNMGGYGYATEYDMEGHVRHALVTTIFGGTNEIQRDIIGKTFGL